MKKFIALTAALMLFATLTAFADEIVGRPDWADNAFQLPEGLVKIENEAFSGDTSITAVAIPEGIESIGEGAFAGCTSLDRIVVFTADVILGVDALGTREEHKEIWGFEGSSAQTYAKSYGYDFIRIYTRTEEDQQKKQAILEYGASLLGQKYVSGTLDCVLFVRRCYLNAPWGDGNMNVLLPDSCPRMCNLSAQSEVTRKHLTVMRIDSVDELQPGDIICWTDDKYWDGVDPSNTNYMKCSHVGMYVADRFSSSAYSGTHVFIEASEGAGKVRYNKFDSNASSYYRRNFLCGWRVLL